MGRNGVVSLRTPKNEVSRLQGFNLSLDYCSWDLLGSLRIFFEQRIAAIKSYRGGRTKGGDVELFKSMEMYQESDTIVGHKVTNSWNLLTYVLRSFPFTDRASSVKVPVASFTLQSLIQLLWENTDSVRSNQQMRPTTPFVPLKLKVFAMLATYSSRAATTLSATSYAHGSFKAFPSFEAKHRLKIHFQVEKRHGFLRGVVEKSWGKESANESSSKFIPCFNSSFVEFIQPCFCFS
nr:hypothetical protein [Tanacetum cinerariifolium]